MRLGILGGSFDPPHVGHLLAATDALETLSLDQLVFVPTGQQPLKPAGAAASPEHRLAMVRLLVGNDPRFAVDAVEIDRPGVSFSVETLAGFAARYPEAERYFLVGSDVLSSFARWREPDRIAQLAHIAVVTRGDEVVDLAGIGGEPVALRTRRVDVSSTEIRERVRRGQSIHGFVPDAVAAYIEAHRLYR